MVTDISGVSARRMLKAMVKGTDSPEVLATLAKGRLRGKQPELAQALTGQVREHHRCLRPTHLEQLEFLEQQIVQFDQRIEQLIQAQSSWDGCPTQRDPATAQPFSWQQAMALLEPTPGVACQSAQLLLAEIGVALSRFPSAARLSKWAGVCPGNHESAGKQYSGKTPPSNRWWRGMLVQMANAAVRCQPSDFAAVYRRLATRRGHKRAILAVAHRLLIAVYHMLRQRQPYRDDQATAAGQSSPEQRLKQLQKRVEQLGYQVQLVPLSLTQASN